MSADFEPALSAEAAVRQAVRIFESAGIDNPRKDARLLAMHALGLSALDLALGRIGAIGSNGAHALTRVVERRIAGEPVARIVGAWEFWALPFRLSPATLVPRPDSETVVETALALIGDRQRPLRLLDLGTGSGCLLVALLCELPRAFGVGTDRSIEALATARGNADANAVGSRVAFLLADWCSVFQGGFDLIVSNPPYIASGSIPGLAREVRSHDPRLALDGGPDGLSAYRAIIEGIASAGLLNEDGALVLEIGCYQADDVSRLGMAAGFGQIGVKRDLAGRDRVVTLQPPLAESISI